VQVETSVESAWLQRLQLKYDGLLSTSAYNFNLRPYIKDSTEALRLMRVAMQQAAWDPKTGQIDMDKILTGHSASDRRQRGAVADGICEILAESNSGKARLTELVVKLKVRPHHSLSAYTILRALNWIPIVYTRRFT